MDKFTSPCNMDNKGIDVIFASLLSQSKETLLNGKGFELCTYPCKRKNVFYNTHFITIIFIIEKKISTLNFHAKQYSWYIHFNMIRDICNKIHFNMEKREIWKSIWILHLFQTKSNLQFNQRDLYLSGWMLHQIDFICKTKRLVLNFAPNRISTLKNLSGWILYQIDFTYKSEETRFKLCSKHILLSVRTNNKERYD